MARELKAQRPGDECNKCEACPYFCGRKGELVICLNPQVTGMERIPTPVKIDEQHPCPYQLSEGWISSR